MAGAPAQRGRPRRAASLNEDSTGCRLPCPFLPRAPEIAAIKTKMMYASTKDFFKGFLDGIGAELQVGAPAGGGCGRMG